MSPIRENNFEDEWRKALNDAEADPSPIVWDNIQKGLGTGTPWWKKAWLLTLLLLLLGAGGTYFYLNFSAHSSGQAPLAQQTSPAPTDSLNQRSDISLLKDSAESSQGNKAQAPASQQANVLSLSKNETSNPASLAKTLKPAGKAPSTHSSSDLDLKSKQVYRSNGQLFSQQEEKITGPDAKDLKKDLPIREILAKSKEKIPPSPDELGSTSPASQNKTRYTQNISIPESLDTYPARVSYTPLGVITRARPEAVPLKPREIRPKTWVQVGLTTLWNSSPTQTNYQNYIGDYLIAHKLSSVEANNFFRSLNEDNQSPQTLGFKVEVGRQLNSRWFIKTGLQYFRQESRIRTNAAFLNPKSQMTHSFWEEIQSDNLLNPVFADLVRDLPEYQPGQNMSIYLEQFNGDQQLRLESETQFLSIPLQVGYRLRARGRFEYILFGGLAADIFIQNQTRNLTTGSQVVTQRDNNIYRPVNWTASFGLEMHYRLNPQLNIFLEPSYRKALRSYTQRGAFLNNPSQSIGLTVGTRFSF